MSLRDRIPQDHLPELHNLAETKCLFGDRCISDVHGPDDCTTQLLKFGHPKANCIVCHRLTSGRTTSTTPPSAICFTCYQQNTPKTILAKLQGKPLPPPAPAKPAWRGRCTECKTPVNHETDTCPRCGAFAVEEL